MSSLYQPPVAQDIEIIGSRVVSDGFRGRGPVIEYREESCPRRKNEHNIESKKEYGGSVPCGGLCKPVLQV